MHSGWTVAGEPLYPSAKGDALRKIPSNEDGRFARVAQLVEQRTENPRVGGSSPPRAPFFLFNH